MIEGAWLGRRLSLEEELIEVGGEHDSNRGMAGRHLLLPTRGRRRENAEITQGGGVEELGVGVCKRFKRLLRMAFGVVEGKGVKDVCGEDRVIFDIHMSNCIPNRFIQHVGIFQIDLAGFEEDGKCVGVCLQSVVGQGVIDGPGSGEILSLDSIEHDDVAEDEIESDTHADEIVDDSEANAQARRLAHGRAEEGGAGAEEGFGGEVGAMSVGFRHRVQSLIEPVGSSKM